MNRIRLILTVLLPLMTVAVSSCSRDDDGYYENSGLYSSSNENLFKDVILYVSPCVEQDGVKYYVVADKLTGLILNIDGHDWGPADSRPLETGHISGAETIAGFVVTKEKMKYPFKVSVQVSADGLTTAGEYALLVWNKLNLSPGSYICNVVSFEVGNAVGTSQKVYTPALWTTLEVQENHVSASIGEFEVAVMQ